MSREQRQWKREKINPLAHIAASWPQLDVSHITYDPNFKRSAREYWIARQAGHDGTQLFTWELLREVLAPLITQTSCLKSKVDTPGVIGIRYVVGPLLLSTCFGMVDLRCGRYPGQVERARIPVICELVFAETASHET